MKALEKLYRWLIAIGNALRSPLLLVIRLAKYSVGLARSVSLPLPVRKNSQPQ